MGSRQYYIAVLMEVKDANYIWANRTQPRMELANFKIELEKLTYTQEVVDSVMKYRVRPSYAYGWNTQEKLDEVAGPGNHYSAKYWEYDSRLGRRWENDPITYPWQSTYATFNNNPVYFKDPLGLYGTRREAKKQRRSARRSGLGVGDIYKLGDDYLFNTNNEKGWHINNTHDFMSKEGNWLERTINEILFNIPNFVGDHSGTGGDGKPMGMERHHSKWPDYKLKTKWLLDDFFPAQPNTTPTDRKIPKREHLNGRTKVKDKEPGLGVSTGPESMDNQKPAISKTTNDEINNKANKNYRIERHGQSDTSFHISKSNDGMNYITDGEGDTIGESLFHPKRYWLKRQKQKD